MAKSPLAQIASKEKEILELRKGKGSERQLNRIAALQEQIRLLRPSQGQQPLDSAHSQPRVLQSPAPPYTRPEVGHSSNTGLSQSVLGQNARLQKENAYLFEQLVGTIHQIEILQNSQKHADDKLNSLLLSLMASERMYDSLFDQHEPVDNEVKRDITDIMQAEKQHLQAKFKAEQMKLKTMVAELQDIFKKHGDGKDLMEALQKIVNRKEADSTASDVSDGHGTIITDYSSISASQVADDVASTPINSGQAEEGAQVAKDLDIKQSGSKRGAGNDFETANNNKRANNQAASSYEILSDDAPKYFNAESYVYHIETEDFELKVTKRVSPSNNFRFSALEKVCDVRPPSASSDKYIAVVMAEDLLHADTFEEVNPHHFNKWTSLVDVLNEVRTCRYFVIPDDDESKAKAMAAIEKVNQPTTTGYKGKLAVK